MSGLSTQAFAGMQAGGEDPMAQLDTDGDGALSISETDSFRESFTQRMGGADRPQLPGPPPGAAQDGSSPSDSTTADGTTRSTEAQRQGFLQHLAEMFASQYARTAADDRTAQALSLSA